MRFERLSRENGLWDKLWKNWSDECDIYGESFADFAPSSLTTLKPLAEDPQTGNAGVYGLVNERGVLAACQLNAAFLPGYTGKVLRLRHLILSPRFDFSDSEDLTDMYVDVLSRIFAGAVKLAESDMKAAHLKLHFRSPADREFFDGISEYLNRHAAFSAVKLQGAWLYISKE